MAWNRNVFIPGHSLFRATVMRHVRILRLAPVISVFLVIPVVFLVSVVFLIVAVFVIPVLFVVFFHNLTSYNFNIGKIS
jgi:hypothetical protein